MIEVELRTFISEQQFNQLLQHLLSTGDELEHTRQITHYLNHPTDTRVQISTEGGRVWQKLGKMHERSRQELEVLMSKINAEIMLDIFHNLGFSMKVSWYRERRAYQIGEMTVSLDNTIGYGRILEAEIRCAESEIDTSHNKLQAFFGSLGLKPGTKEEFDAAFTDYLRTWREKTSHLDNNWITMQFESEVHV
jgi:predicted adenylyl cyclase CyaB